MIIGFHHPGIVVSNLERAAQFYGEVFGFQPIRRDDWDDTASEIVERVIDVKGSAAKCLLLKGPNCFLELFEYIKPKSHGNPHLRRANDYGLAHLAFQVSDIWAAFEAVKSAGGGIHGDPVKLGDGYAIYCRDPFGNIIELAQIGAEEPDFNLIHENLLPP